MTPTNTDLIHDFIELNPRCTRKQIIESTNISKESLGHIMRKSKHMFIVDIELDSKNRSVEHYTINPHFGDQNVAIKEFEPIKVKHHHLFAMYGMAA